MLKRLQNAAAIALFACIVLFAMKTVTASQQPQSPQPHASERAERPRENENRANTNSDITYGFYLKKYSAYCDTQPANENDKWRHEFWCEFKITDAIIAAFTVILTIVTTGLIIVGICQTRQVAKTFSLARDEFNATNRPKLRVRRMKPQPYGNPTRIEYVIVNIGETSAPIKRNEFTLCAQRIGRKETLQNFSLECPQLKGGEQRTFSANIDAQYDYGWGLVNSICRIGGTIDYEDKAWILRSTRFSRTYDTELRRFRASDDTEEDYED